MEVALAAAAIAFATALGSLFVASRLGLTGVQREARAERQALVETLKDRIAQVEAKNEEQAEHIARLEDENKALRRRLETLERRFIEDVMEDADDLRPELRV